MESIGQVLRAERDKRGLSLSEVYDDTKITIQNLEALEQDRFDYFPNRVYARAFLRDYANFLGLDSAQLLTAYEDEWTLPAPASEKKDAASEGEPGSRRLLAPIAAVLVILLLLVAGYFGYTALGGRGQQADSVSTASVDHETSTQPDEPLTGPELAPETEPEVQIEAESEPEEPATAAAEEQPQPPPAVPDKLTLEVAARTAVWVLVRTDDTVAFQGTLPKGSVKTFEARQTMYIRSGMAGAVDLKLNGKPAQPLGTLREVGSRTWKLEDIKRQAAASDAQQTAPAAGNN